MCNSYRKKWGFGPLPERPARRVNARRKPADQKIREARPSREPKLPAPLPPGPGTELKKIFESLGVKPNGCGACMATLHLMNDLGSTGCRERRDELIKDIKSRGPSYSLKMKIRAAGMAIFSGLAFSINPLDPIGSLFDEAIRRFDGALAPAPVHRTWSYGVMTVPSRRNDLLPQTLASLKAAGFDRPVLFIDGGDSAAYADLGLPIFSRSTALGNFGNWLASAVELYLRDPHADFYSLFEDDILISRGARSYIEATATAPDAYFSLYTCPSNEITSGMSGTGWFRTITKDAAHHRAVLESHDQLRDGSRWQHGLGALGLVFPREVFRRLLKQHNMMDHPASPPELDPKRKSDGVIATSMNRAGVAEYCHIPSLMQHVGDQSTLGHGRFPKSKTFRGEAFDFMSLLLARSET
jgi:hypothetical protein